MCVRIRANESYLHSTLYQYLKNLKMRLLNIHFELKSSNSFNKTFVLGEALEYIVYNDQMYRDYNICIIF